MKTAATAVEDRVAEADLMDVVGRLRRAVRRRVRRGWAHTPLTESERELLRLVSDHPGLRVLEAAAAIGVAPNTVSTLVRRLTERGLLERRVDEDDARAARLVLSAAARRRFAEWRDRRHVVLADAMGRLSAEDRRAIEAAVPALSRLLQQVESS